MHVNIFKRVKASWPQETELDKIVDMMQSSEKIRLDTLFYRQYRARYHKMGADELKITRFPAFAPCALLYGGKGRDYVTGLTDLCYLDFDNVKDEKRLIDAMNILRKDRYVLMASRSVSNEGLHILVRYKLKDMEMPPQRTTMTPNEMQDMYGEVYDYLGAKYLYKLALMPDYNARHMERLYIVSYDPELYYNPDAETLTIDLNELITDDGSRPFVMSLGEKILEAERLISKCCLDEAEKLILECQEWIVSNIRNNSDISEQDGVIDLPKLDDYLTQIKNVKPIIARVNELMEEVDEDLRNLNTKVAHKKIVESQQLLKKVKGLCRSGIGRIRKRVVKYEMKMGAINKEIRRKRHEEMLFDK